MIRKASLLLAVLVCAGCGQSAPLTPEQLVRAGHYDDAINECTQALRLNPRDADAYLYRGRAYHSRNKPGDLELAIDDFTHANEFAPDNPEPLYSRSLAYRDLGKPDESAADEKKARERDPRLKEIYSQLPDVVAEPARVETAEPIADTSKSDEKPAGVGSRSEGLGQGLQGLNSRRLLRTTPTPETTAAPAQPAERVLPQPQPQSQRRNTRDLAQEQSGFDEDLTNNDAFPDAFPQPPRQADPRGKGKAAARPGSRNAGARTGGRSDGFDSRRAGGYPPANPFGGQQNFGNGPQFGNALPPLARSPFPQRQPAPTGFVEQPLSPFNVQPRQPYSTPYSAPNVRPPGAYHDDFNP
jgi:hypothetical protein